MPAEGTTGWSDTWMIAPMRPIRAACIMWMDHMMSAEANGQATVYFGEAPTSQEACDYAETMRSGPLRADPRHRRGVLGRRLVLEHAARTADDDDGTTCVTSDAWVEAWTTCAAGQSAPLSRTDPMLPGGPPPGSIIV